MRAVNAMAKPTQERQSLLYLAVAAIAETLGNIAHNVKEGWENLHIGRGHFTAWVRLGFKELTHMLLPAFPQGQFINEEPGLWGNPTQGEVARGRQDEAIKPMTAAALQVSSLNEEPVRGESARSSPGAPTPAQPSGQEATSKDIVEQARAAGQDAPDPDAGRDQSIERER
jgi:hypothetical protein